MSIALDLALYLRENPESTLTLPERGLLFTLFFRVGSNPFTWVSQLTLAEECSMKERQIRNLMKSIESKGYIEITQSSKDRRKLVYRPAAFLINCHQSKRRFAHKYRQNIAGNNENTGNIMPVNTGNILPVLNSEQTAETHATTALAESAQTPKAKEQSKKKSKEKIFCASDAAHDSFETFWLTYPRKRDKKRTQRIWMIKKLHEKADLILQDVLNRKRTDPQWKDSQYIPHPSTYLNGERWTDEIDPKQNQGEKSHGRTETNHQRVWRLTKELSGKGSQTRRTEKDAEPPQEEFASRLDPKALC